MENYYIWIGIVVCLTQSAMFSGLNLAFFSLNRLRLEIEAEASPKSGARNVLRMRRDSNFLLTTILWGNVGINVLLTLLSDSVMTGLLTNMVEEVGLIIEEELQNFVGFRPQIKIERDKGEERESGGGDYIDTNTMLQPLQGSALQKVS